MHAIAPKPSITPDQEQPSQLQTDLRAVHNVRLADGSTGVSALYPTSRTGGMPSMLVLPSQVPQEVEGASQFPGSAAATAAAVTERLAAAWNIASGIDQETLLAMSEGGLTIAKLSQELHEARLTLTRIHDGAKGRLARLGDDFVDSGLIDLCADTLSETNCLAEVTRPDAALIAEPSHVGKKPDVQPARQQSHFASSIAAFRAVVSPRVRARA